MNDYFQAHQIFEFELVFNSVVKFPIRGEHGLIVEQVFEGDLYP